MRPIRDSYHIRLWISGKAATYLMAKYGDDLEVATAKLIDENMQADAKANPVATERPTQDYARLRGKIVRLQPQTSEIRQAQAELEQAREALAQERQALAEEMAKLQEMRSQPIQPIQLSDLKDYGKKVQIAIPQLTLDKRPRHPSQPPELQQRPSMGAINSDNPVGQIQELCHKLKAKMPGYSFSHSSQGFKCECVVTLLGKSVRGEGEGTTKKKAKHQSAIAALEALGFNQ